MKSVKTKVATVNAVSYGHPNHFIIPDFSQIIQNCQILDRLVLL